MISLAVLLALMCAQPQTVGAAGVRVDERSERFHFIYAWPAEAHALPSLRRALEERRDSARRFSQEQADAQWREAAENRSSAPSHSYAQEWRSIGRSGRLLSLASLAAFYRGGAHGGADYEGILWDTRDDQPIGMAELFRAFEWADRFSERYCDALNEARREKLDAPDAAEEQLGPCPDLAERIALPADTDRDGRFDTLSILLPPYAAGSYAEGTYEVDVPFTAADVARVRPDFRAAFEAGR